MNKSILNCIVAFTILMLFAAIGLAEVPNIINYQGRLTNSSGDPLDTTVSMVFAIYDDKAGGDLKWTETHPSVSVTNGLFNVVLGDGTPPVPIEEMVFSGPDRWLEITVGGEIISPRSKLASNPYAFESGAPYEPGIARNVYTTGVSLVSGDMQDIVTVEITTPASGYIHLTGRCYVRFNNTKSYRGAYIQIDEEAGGSTESGAYVQLYLDSTVHDDIYRFPAYVDRVYQKAAGTYTFRLEGYNSSAAGGQADVYGAAITAIYYPTSYGSVTKLVQNPGDHPDAMPVTNADEEEPKNTTYEVDLLYYELQAKNARLRALQAERDLLKAQMQAAEASSEGRQK